MPDETPTSTPSPSMPGDQSAAPQGDMGAAVDPAPSMDPPTPPTEPEVPQMPPATPEAPAAEEVGSEAPQDPTAPAL